MKPRQWLAPAAIMLLIAGVIALNHHYRARGGVETVLQCADLRQGCRAMLGDRDVTLGVTGELRLLAPFDLWVKASGVDRVEASFTMVGMDMGFNLYTLHADAQGLYRARITLPVCVTGRNDWQLHVDIDGRRLTVPFVTEL